MHRSGTSAIARVINLLGADISGDLMPPVAGNNDRGFWESTALREIHDRLLTAIGSSWDDPLSLPEGWIRMSAAAEARAEIRKRLDQDFAQSQIFVVKDPRLSLFLPLWLGLLDERGVEPIIVVPFRNPLEVAHSLKTRDGIPLAKSTLLYARSNLDTEAASRGRKRLFIDYGSLLANWRPFSRRLRALAGSFLRPPSPDIVAEIESFLTADLYRNRATRADLTAEPQVTGVAIDVYDLLTEAAKDASDTALRRSFNRLDRMTVDLAQTLQALLETSPAAALAPDIGHDQASQVVDRALDQMAEARADLARRLDEMSAQAVQLNEVRLSLASQIAAAAANAAHAVNNIAALEAARADLARQLGEARAGLAELAAARDRLQRQLDEARFQTQALELKLQGAEAKGEQEARQAERLRKELDEDRSRIAELFAAREAHGSRIEEARDRASELAMRLARFETTRTTLTRQLGEARSRASEALAGREALQLELDEARAEAQRLALKAQEAGARLQQQALEIDVLTKDLVLARSGDAEHGATRDALQREIQEARSRAEALEMQAREAAARAEQLASENSALTQQLEEARNPGTAVPAARDNLQRDPERPRAGQCVAARAEAAEAAEASIQQLSTQIELLSRDLQQSRAATEELRRDGETKDRQVALLTKELEQARTRAGEFQAGRDALRLKMEEARSEAQSLAAQAQKADTQAEQHAWQIEVLAKDLDLARGRAAELAARRDLLQRQMEEIGWGPPPTNDHATQGNGADQAAKPNGATQHFVREAPETVQPADPAEIIANIVRASGLFDAEDYRLRAGVTSEDLDPAIHYVTEGERQGVAPSSRFDPSYYAERYPDVAAAGMCLLKHYAMHGQTEGRRARSVAAGFTYEPGRFDSAKESILLVSHEASRTGAPVLALAIAQKLCARYNVITILLRGGDLIEKFSQVSSHLIVLEDNDRDFIEYKYAVDSIRHRQPIRYAIVSSIESRLMMPILGRALIPTVNLIHEFSSYTRPLGAVRESLGWTSELVFSTNATADSFRVEHAGLLNRRLHVLPQGRCETPPSLPSAGADAEREKLAAAMRPPGYEDAFVVLGAGFVHIRKGVDLFIATAAAAAKLAGKRRRIRFVWIGGGYEPDGDMGYSVYLAEQLARSGGDHIVILDPVKDLEPAYALADAFLLSSRLDPMPNVTIEAAMHGMPVVCFDGSSGIAEVLKRDAISAKTVVPHLDTHAAARCIVELAKDQELRERIGRAARSAAEATFDMDRYIRDIDAIGGLAVGSTRQRQADLETIAADPLFDPTVSLPAHNSSAAREDAILRFLANWSAARIGSRQNGHLDLRRPCAGFNPQIYALHHPQIFEQDINPLADFIRNGKPEGPWLHRVIRPDHAMPGPSALRVAIQAHFHYPELIEEFLAKLAVNETCCDLLLSTNDGAKAEQLRAATEKYQRGRAEVRVFQNRGRDIAPLLTGFAQEIARNYDVIGHLHAKRSLGVAAEMGEIWREFLWQHLLGDRHAMMDVAVAAFADKPELGLVFPEEPHLCDWDQNLPVAEEVAARAGLETPLPPFFEFPVGTMFWGRPQALKPLFALELDWDDYPDEPLPNDGTMLHALERLLPFAAAKQGFIYATLHIPGVRR